MPASTNGSRSGIGGPNTLEGKLRTARNAVKHGLNSSQPVVLDFETPEAWEAFETSFVESLHPANAAERCLAVQIALTMWRLRRIPLYEARQMNACLQSAEATWERSAPHRIDPTEEDLEVALQAKLTEALLRNQETDRLIRYEAHLDRKLSRLFREFHHLQKLRNELPVATSDQRQGTSSSTSEDRASHCDPTESLPSSSTRDLALVPAENREAKAYAHRSPGVMKIGGRAPKASSKTESAKRTQASAIRQNVG